MSLQGQEILLHTYATYLHTASAVLTWVALKNLFSCRNVHSWVCVSVCAIGVFRVTSFSLHASVEVSLLHFLSFHIKKLIFFSHHGSLQTVGKHKLTKACGGHIHTSTCRHAVLHSLRRSGCKMILSLWAFHTCLPGQFPHSWLPQLVWPFSSLPSLPHPPNPDPPSSIPGLSSSSSSPKACGLDSCSQAGCSACGKHPLHMRPVVISLSLCWLAGWLARALCDLLPINTSFELCAHLHLSQSPSQLWENEHTGWETCHETIKEE